MLAVAPAGVGLAALLALDFSGVLVERSLYVPVILGSAAAASVAGVAVSRFSARAASLRASTALATLTAMGITGAAITLAMAVMLLPPPDLRVLVIIFLFSAGLGVILELTVARALSEDIVVLRNTVKRVAGGDYGARSRLDRLDEVGEAARMIDRLAEQLDEVELERAHSHSSRQAFLTAVGHDLRTPLAALRASVEALEDGLAPDTQRYYTAMHHDLDALAGLVDDLFLLARLESGRLSFPRVTVDLAELTDEAVEALTPMARRRNVRIRLETTGQVYTVGGPAELSRTVRNLLDNAIRHSPPASEVVVQVTGSDDPLVRVIDQGPGFPEEASARLIDGFARMSETDRPTADGAGLGLEIARRLVEAHQGRVWIEPGPGGRICFSVPGQPVAGSPDP